MAHAWWKAAVVIAAALCADTATAEITATPATIDVPAPGQSQAVASVVLLHDEGLALSGLSVSVVSIQGPRGPMDPAADPPAVWLPRAEDMPALTRAPAARVPLEIGLRRDAFAAPGEYAIVLRVNVTAGTGADGRLIEGEDVTLTLHREPAEIEVSWAEDRLVVLERDWPWETAGGARAIAVNVTSGDLDQVHVVGTEPVHATVEAGEGSIAGNRPVIPVTEGGGSGTIEFTNFGHAGEFTAELTFRDARLAESVSVPIRIQVCDYWILPLIVIALGVVISAGAHILVHNLRPRHVSLVRVAQLQVTLEMLDNAIESAQTRARYNALASRLDGLSEAIDLVADPAAELTAVEEEIGKLAEDIATTEDNARKKLPELRSSFDTAKEALEPHATTTEDKLTPVSDMIGRAGSLLAAGRVEAAANQLDRASRALAETVKGLVNEALDALKSEINRGDATRRDALLERLEQTREKLQAEDADIAALLDALRAEIDNTSLPVRLAGASAPQGKASLSVSPDARLRVVATAVEFELTPVAGRTVKEIRWRLGPYVLDPTPDTKVSRVFTSAGRYEAAATITYAGGSSEEVRAPFQILRSAAQRRASSLIGSIRRMDLGLFLIAALLATVGGMLQLYIDKPFGSLGDYLLALAWGFGIETATRGFAATFTLVKGTT